MDDKMDTCEMFNNLKIDNLQYDKPLNLNSNLITYNVMQKYCLLFCNRFLDLLPHIKVFDVYKSEADIVALNGLKDQVCNARAFIERLDLISFDDDFDNTKKNLEILQNYVMTSIINKCIETNIIAVINDERKILADNGENALPDYIYTKNHQVFKNFLITFNDDRNLLCTIPFGLTYIFQNKTELVYNYDSSLASRENYSKSTGRDIEGKMDTMLHLELLELTCQTAGEAKLPYFPDRYINEKLAYNFLQETLKPSIDAMFLKNELYKALSIKEINIDTKYDSEFEKILGHVLELYKTLYSNSSSKDLLENAEKYNAEDIDRLANSMINKEDFTTYKVYLFNLISLYKPKYEALPEDVKIRLLQILIAHAKTCIVFLDANFSAFYIPIIDVLNLISSKLYARHMLNFTEIQLYVIQKYPDIASKLCAIAPSFIAPSFLSKSK